MKAQIRSRGTVVNLTPWPLYPPEMTRYPLYRGLGGPHGRSGRVRKPPPRPDQPVSIHYTDWAKPAHVLDITKVLIFVTCSFSDHDLILRNCIVFPSRPQWPRGLKRTSAADRLIRLLVRVPLRHGCVSCECRVLSGRCLSDEPITRLEQSYRMWCVVCDLEIWTRRPQPAFRRSSATKKKKVFLNDALPITCATQQISCSICHVSWKSSH